MWRLSIALDFEGPDGEAECSDEVTPAQLGAVAAARQALEAGGWRVVGESHDARRTLP